MTTKWSGAFSPTPARAIAPTIPGNVLVMAPPGFKLPEACPRCLADMPTDMPGETVRCPYCECLVLLGGEKKGKESRAPFDPQEVARAQERDRRTARVVTLRGPVVRDAGTASSWSGQFSGAGE
jgi:hypothetical protein